jgi:hypothetical protein
MPHDIAGDSKVADKPKDDTAKAEVAEDETTPEVVAEEVETFEVPDDLSEIADIDALVELSNLVKARGAELTAAGFANDDDLAEAEALAAVDDRLTAELATRHEAMAARDAKAAEFAAKFAKTDTTEDPTPEVVAEVVAEPAVEEAAVVPSKPQTFNVVRKTASAVAARSTAAEARPSSSAFMERTNFAHGGDAGEPIENVRDLADAIHRKRYSFGNIPAGMTDYLPIATGEKSFGDARPLTLDPVENFTVLREAQRDMESLVAAGACCTPQTPLYEFFRTAVPQNPVEGAIPVRSAPRGGIRFITAVCSTADAAEGISDYDCDDAAQEELVVKPCVRMGCPDVEEVLVQAVTKCVTFDNLRYRTFPEQVENFLEDLAVEFAAHKEVNYLNGIDAASTQVYSNIGYGASRSLFFDWQLAAVGYRRRNRMRRDADLTLLAPSWAIDLIKADMLNDGDQGLSFLNVPDAQVNDALRSRGLSVTWYEDTATGADQGFRPTQSVGQLNSWPETVRSYLFAPGTFVRLDGGTLDVGIVRDSVLNGTNDLQIFMEEWWALAQLGCESIALSSDVCPNGARADRVTPFTCVESTS